MCLMGAMGLKLSILLAAQNQTKSLPFGLFLKNPPTLLYPEFINRRWVPCIRVSDPKPQDRARIGESPSGWAVPRSPPSPERRPAPPLPLAPRHMLVLSKALRQRRIDAGVLGYSSHVFECCNRVATDSSMSMKSSKPYPNHLV